MVSSTESVELKLGSTHGAPSESDVAPKSNLLVSLLCKPFFFLLGTQKGVGVTGVSRGDRRNWEQESLRDRNQRIFCEEGLGKINKCDLELFQNGSAHEFYRLKELITLEELNSSVVEKKT